WVTPTGHYEPYVAPTRWSDIQARLSSNRWRLKAPLGRGDALIQGLLRCTRHDLMVKTTYPGRTRLSDGTERRLACYSCQPNVDAGESGGCLQIMARCVDPVIEAEILR